MIVPCPNCGSQVELNGPPVRGNANDGSKAWVCLYCPNVVCVDCYHVHTGERHPSATKEWQDRRKKKKKR